MLFSYICRLGYIVVIDMVPAVHRIEQLRMQLHQCLVASLGMQVGVLLSYVSIIAGHCVV